jgi:hypothetical protein
VHKNSPCTTTALQNDITCIFASCPECVAKFMCCTACSTADGGTISSSSAPAETDMTALYVWETPVLLALQSCRIV